MSGKTFDCIMSESKHFIAFSKLKNVRKKKIMLSTCRWRRRANASEILDGAQRDRLLTSAEPTYLTQGYLPHVCISLRA